MRVTTRFVRPVSTLLFAGLIVACGTPAPTSTPSLPTAPTLTASAPTSGPTTAVVRTETGLLALLTQVQGDADVSEVTDSGERWTHAARPMQVLRAGAVVRVSAQAFIGLICSNERWVELSGEIEWQLTEEACRQGRELPPGTYHDAAPKAGRILDYEGNKVIERKTREKEGDYGRIPVILDPRNTALLELQPTLSWVEVQGAIEYVLSMSGPEVFEEITLAADEVTCQDHARAAPHQMCTAPWPASQWHLEQGQRYFLTISARTGVASEPRPSEKSVLRTLPEETAGDVQRTASAIGALGVDAVTRDLLLAGLYAHHGLYQRCIAAYGPVLDEAASPALYVALGDTYVQTELYRWAFHAYNRALDMLSEGTDDPAVRAAAEFGLGLVKYNYEEKYAEAAAHFASSLQLFEQLGADVWAQAAQRGIEEARERVQ
jgi:tetratricopeptide (TPR) repeat protein